MSTPLALLGDQNGVWIYFDLDGVRRLLRCSSSDGLGPWTEIDLDPTKSRDVTIPLK